MASGLLLGLAFPPFHLLVPSFVALVPYGVWLARVPGGPVGGSRALRGGFYLGLLYFTLVFYWLLVALVFYTPLALVAFLGPVLIMSVFLAVATVGAHLAIRRLGWPVWLALPVFWTATEWTRAHLGPISFPWMELGASLTAYPRLLGAADVVGTRGISFWLALLNGLLAALILRRWPGMNPDGTGTPGGSEPDGAAESEGAGRSPMDTGAASGPRRAMLLLGTAYLAVLAGPLVYSQARWEGVSLRPAVTVGVIQPNVPEDIKLQRDVAADSARAATNRLVAGGALRRADGPAPELLILPETVLPLYVEPAPELGYPGRPEHRRWVAELARRSGAPVLYGSLGLRAPQDATQDHAAYNSAFLVAPGGERVARYDKKYLVPMVERVPFVPPEWLSWMEYMGDFAEGTGPQLMQVRGASFGVLICYESIFADLSRQYRRQGADLLVNITNDAWFGRHEPWWARSSALWQHPAHLVMRAIENRMGVARAANTGVSEIVDPLGRVTRRTPLFVEAAFSGTVYTSDERTLYTRWGDWPGLVATLMAAAALLLGGWRARRTGTVGAGESRRIPHE